MLFAHRIRSFVGPWLAFALLNGLGTGLLCGLIVTVAGLALGIFAGLDKLSDGAILQLVRSLVSSFPTFALFVLGGAVTGFVAGIVTGSISALFGGKAGMVWSAISCFGAYCITASYFSMSSRPIDLVTVPIFLFVGALGSLVPLNLLSVETPLFSWDAPLRRWMRASWLTSPPQAAKVAAIFWPVILFLAVDSYFILPIYLSNQNYVARMGKWATWQNSRRFAGNNSYSRRWSCQSNLKQVMLGLLQYQQDYDDLYPPKPNSPKNGVAAVLWPYLKAPQLFQCPQDFFNDDSGNYRSGDFTDYWFNARLYSVNQAGISSLAQVASWGDGNTGKGEANAAYSLSSIPLGFPPARRHWNSANYAFADGHVKALRSGVVSNAPSLQGTFYTMVP